MGFSERPWRGFAGRSFGWREYMRKRSILLLTGALVLVAGLVIGPAATAKSSQASAGTVVIGNDQEPAILNIFLTAGNSYTTAEAINPVLAGGSVYNNHAQLVPLLFAAPPKIVKSNPLTVTFSYKKTAQWSDGKPVTGADFVATYKTIMNPNYDITDRSGWEDIQSVKAKGKSV